MGYISTGYCFTKKLKRKDEAAQRIIRIFFRLEQLTGIVLGTLFRKNGREFAKTVLAKFMDEKGIYDKHCGNPIFQPSDPRSQIFPVISPKSGSEANFPQVTLLQHIGFPTGFQDNQIATSSERQITRP
ncbi:uncharacterized protein VP01_2169g5 [Puccinia sorghi]|uniref:Uncharacterized protein n=1 Tax=Puccinia sorghi TaxID=27349 RepID=A0A0L6VA42_9BASI|nr:uncharacterized protein VP01_2169g5 [Puccinia sorghi]